MKYSIKAIPTEYNGVNFRSRLEARWAAFFDLCGWDWEYEPFDLEGWTPDFLIRTSISEILVEVKPVELISEQFSESKIVDFKNSEFDKAKRHMKNVPVMLLGIRPQINDRTPGALCDPPENQTYSNDDDADVSNFEYWYTNFRELIVDNSEDKWKEAGNIVQWKGKKVA